MDRNDLLVEYSLMRGYGNEAVLDDWNHWPPKVVWQKRSYGLGQKPLSFDAYAKATGEA